MVVRLVQLNIICIRKQCGVIEDRSFTSAKVRCEARELPLDEVQPTICVCGDTRNLRMEVNCRGINGTGTSEYT